RFMHRWYRDPAAIEKMDNQGYVQAQYEAMSNLLLTGIYTLTREESSVYSFWRNDFLVGPKYTYAKDSFVFFSVGNSWISYDHGDTESKVIWDAGVTHAFEDNLLLTVLADTKYEEDPQSSPKLRRGYSVTLQKTWPRTVMLGSLYYNRYYLTQSSTLDWLTYGFHGNVKYEVMPRLTAACDLVLEKLERKIAPTSNTKIILLSLPVTYDLTQKISLMASYSFNKSSSAQLDTDNWRANKFILSATAKF
ncbi:MAG TPA: hypothetical protein VK445_07235, partial [Dissulfurispiraceae bacterium]|nr:hypothetical protein [Dissulfurispiraceae bacterium]